MRLYIVRHADPDYANRTITTAGHEEARVLAERLDIEGITHLHTSPLGRAVDTARYAAERLGLSPGVEEWARELDLPRIEDPDDRRPLPAFCVAGQTIRGVLPPPHHGNWYEREPLTDPEFLQAYERVCAASDEFLVGYGYERAGGVYRVSEASWDRIAVICHGGLARTWLAHLLEIPLSLMWCGFWLPPSSVTTIVFEERTRGVAVPLCLSMGDTSHLY